MIYGLNAFSQFFPIEEQDLFVFPSMQMEGIAAASSNSHVPMVEVVYRGQPPAATPNEVVSTTVKTSEVITTSTPKPKPPTGGKIEGNRGNRGNF